MKEVKHTHSDKGSGNPSVETGTNLPEIENKKQVRYNKCYEGSGGFQSGVQGLVMEGDAAQ